VLKEFYQSEKNYVGNLQMLVNRFLKPLKTNGVLKEKEVKLIFGNVELLLKMHMSLVAELEDEEVGNIGEILKGFVPYLKVYKEYINSYDGAIKTVLEMRGKSKEFDKFLLDAFNDTLCDGLDFIAYLVTPIQRLPRYELMLKDLLNHSQEDKQLEDVYDKVTAVNKFFK